MRNTVTNTDLENFRRIIMPMKVYRLINKDTNPEIVEVFYSSVSNETWGVKFTFYEKQEALINCSVKEIRVNIDYEVSEKDFFVDHSVAKVALNNAVNARISNINDTITKLNIMKGEFEDKLKSNIK